MTTKLRGESEIEGACTEGIMSGHHEPPTKGCNHEFDHLPFAEADISACLQQSYRDGHEAIAHSGKDFLPSLSQYRAAQCHTTGSAAGPHTLFRNGTGFYKDCS